MASPSPIDRRFTAEEYLVFERAAGTRHEFVDGDIVAMTGDSPRHSRVKFNLARAIGNQLVGGPCDGYDSDLLVRVDPGRYAYSDLTVVCGEARFEGDALANPTVIFEVLSRSTEATDRGEKWERYWAMPSLRQYVLISQGKPLIEVFTRHADVWTFADARGQDASIDLPAIDCTLSLADVYARVEA